MSSYVERITDYHAVLYLHERCTVLGIRAAVADMTRADGLAFATSPINRGLLQRRRRPEGGRRLVDQAGQIGIDNNGCQDCIRSLAHQLHIAVETGQSPRSGSTTAAARNFTNACCCPEASLSLLIRAMIGDP